MPDFRPDEKAMGCGDQRTRRSFALGFVIYNSDATLLTRLRLSVEYGFDVYIFDNSPQHEMVRDFARSCIGVKYLTCGKNLGLGLGMAAVCSQAFYDRHQALLFFDQDSVFDESTLNFIELFQLEQPELGRTHSAVVFRARTPVTQGKNDCFRDVRLSINSGSLFYLDKLKALDWHSEKYFVDCVDYEFCLRSKRMGFRIGEYSCTPGFDHSIEQPDKIYTLFGWRYAMRAYSPTRIWDKLRSSLKLIVSALFSGEIAFAMSVARLFAIYMAVQVLVRLLNLVEIRGGRNDK